MKKIFIFDFDGTISNKDSFWLLTFYSLGFFKNIKYWIYVLFFFPFRTKSQLKEVFFKNFIGNDINSFNHLCANFISKFSDRLIKESFLEYVKNIDKDSEIVIVSASISNYLKPWCDKMDFDLISTELEVINGELTGRFSTPNCNGKEKVRRIKEKYNLSEYDDIHVFGNSKGDLPMLELGTDKYYKFFK